MVEPQVNSKLLQMLDDMISGRHDPVSAIVEGEMARGFKVIRPGDAPWFRAVSWRAASVASVKGKRVRLVLLHAFEEGRGSLTATLVAINEAGLKPAIIDPTRELAATLKRRGWSMRVEGTTFEDREDVWTPPKREMNRMAGKISAEQLAEARLAAQALRLSPEEARRALAEWAKRGGR